MTTRHLLGALAALTLALPATACATRLQPAPAPTTAYVPSRAMLRTSVGTHEHEQPADHPHGHERSVEHQGHAHQHDHPPLLRAHLGRGWCHPPLHGHASACGTPYVHGFLTEPAFLGRDLFLDITRTDEGTEFEAELEWALTRRLGLVAELPYIDEDSSGFGDAAIGLRALLMEYRRFLLSASGEVELPTGSERRGLGRGHLAVAGRLHTWLDLGAWWTLQGQAGVEHAPEDDETEFIWSATLAKSFCARPLVRTRRCAGHAHGPTTVNLLAEIEGATALSEDRGHTEGRWLLGASAPLTDRLDLRAAFSRTFGGEEDEEAWTIGAIFHF